MVLADVKEHPLKSPGVNRVVGKHLRFRIVAIQKLVGPDPELSGAIFEQRKAVATGETVRISRIVTVFSKGAVAVVALQAVLCAKPQEAQIVLYDLAHP